MSSDQLPQKVIVISETSANEIFYFAESSGYAENPCGFGAALGRVHGWTPSPVQSGFDPSWRPKRVEHPRRPIKA
jgi:hypothetical protein